MITKFFDRLLLSRETRELKKINENYKPIVIWLGWDKQNKDILYETRQKLLQINSKYHKRKIKMFVWFIDAFIRR